MEPGRPDPMTREPRSGLDETIPVSGAPLEEITADENGMPGLEPERDGDGGGDGDKNPSHSHVEWVRPLTTSEILTEKTRRDISTPGDGVLSSGDNDRDAATG